MTEKKRPGVWSSLAVLGMTVGYFGCVHFANRNQLNWEIVLGVAAITNGMVAVLLRIQEREP